MKPTYTIQPVCDPKFHTYAPGYRKPTAKQQRKRAMIEAATKRCFAPLCKAKALRRVLESGMWVGYCREHI